MIGRYFEFCHFTGTPDHGFLRIDNRFYKIHNIKLLDLAGLPYPMNTPFKDAITVDFELDNDLKISKIKECIVF